MARIFKEKYYPKHTFLEAKIGYNPSYAWRGMMNAPNLLKEGLVWRVRNGASIRIWKDKWILSPSTYAIQSPIKLLDADAKVKELIDGSTNC